MKAAQYRVGGRAFGITQAPKKKTKWVRFIQFIKKVLKIR